MKKYLDALVEKYEVESFIKNDPIQFPHTFKNEADIEIAAFISALFAYGKRELFIKKLKILFAIMENKPYEFILNYPENSFKINGFGYRFAKDVDLQALLEILYGVYACKKSLKTLFCEAFDGDLHSCQKNVVNQLYKSLKRKPGAGFCHLLSKPDNGGATKRLNMFLRWMVRDGAVDLGLWDFIPKSALFIPLDVHVGRISRQLGLLERKSNDFKAVFELTQTLKKFDPKDPVKYDFAMFGYGVDT